MSNISLLMLCPVFGIKPLTGWNSNVSRLELRKPILCSPEIRDTDLPSSERFTPPTLLLKMKLI